MEIQKLADLELGRQYSFTAIEAYDCQEVMYGTVIEYDFQDGFIESVTILTTHGTIEGVDKYLFDIKKVEFIPVPAIKEEVKECYCPEMSKYNRKEYEMDWVSCMQERCGKWSRRVGQCGCINLEVVGVEKV